MGRRRRRITFQSQSAEETYALGLHLGCFFKAPKVISLSGDLGAGKTTLIKGVAHSLTGIEKENVTSPTFGLMHCYSDDLKIKKLYHFDLYRLKTLAEFLDLGFDELLEESACIEWPEKILSILPENCLNIYFRINNETQREIIVEADHDEAILESIKLHCTNPRSEKFSTHS